MPRKSRKIISRQLATSPCGADNLSSKDNLLLAWRWADCIMGEDNTKYHFAMYSSAWGWRACSWDEKYETPWRIFPATQDVVWVNTQRDYLMRLQIEQNGEAAITARTRSDNLLLLDADKNGCLVREEQKVKYLRFVKDNEQLFKTSSYTYYSRSNYNWAHLIQDGAIAVFDSDAMRLLVLSPEGDKLYEEDVPFCAYYHPFIIYVNHDQLCYTDDPRKGWTKNDALKMHRAHTVAHDSICFFAKLDDMYYIAIKDNNYNIHLYRFSSESPTHIEHIWEMARTKRQCTLVHHNGLICIATPERIYGIHIPDNDGFLAWDPINNTFHTDIPRTVNIQKAFAGWMTSVRIPDIWGQDIRQW